MSVGAWNTAAWLQFGTARERARLVSCSQRIVLGDQAAGVASMTVLI